MLSKYFQIQARVKMKSTVIFSEYMQFFKVIFVLDNLTTGLLISKNIFVFNAPHFLVGKN